MYLDTKDKLSMEAKQMKKRSKLIKTTSKRCAKNKDVYSVFYKTLFTMLTVKI